MALETAAAAPLGARNSTCRSHKCHLAARNSICRSHKCRLGARNSMYWPRKHGYLPHRSHLGARNSGSGVAGRSKQHLPQPQVQIGRSRQHWPQPQVPLERSIKHLPQPPSAAWTLEPAICVQLGVPNAATVLYLPRRSCCSAESSSFSVAERSMQQRPQPGAVYALATAATEPPAAA